MSSSTLERRWNEQRLTIRQDPKTIEAIANAYGKLDDYHRELKENQARAMQRVLDGEASVD